MRQGQTKATQTRQAIDITRPHLLREVLKIVQIAPWGCAPDNTRGGSFSPLPQHVPCPPQQETRGYRAPLGLASSTAEQPWGRNADPCLCLRHHSVNQRKPVGTVSRLVWIRGGAGGGGFRYQTACSVNESSYRPLRNDSSLLPRWKVCLSKERGWYKRASLSSFPML